MKLTTQSYIGPKNTPPPPSQGTRSLTPPPNGTFQSSLLTFSFFLSIFILPLELNFSSFFPLFIFLSHFHYFPVSISSFPPWGGREEALLRGRASGKREDEYNLVYYLWRWFPQWVARLRSVAQIHQLEQRTIFRTRNTNLTLVSLYKTSSRHIYFLCNYLK